MRLARTDDEVANVRSDASRCAGARGCKRASPERSKEGEGRPEVGKRGRAPRLALAARRGRQPTMRIVGGFSGSGGREPGADGAAFGIIVISPSSAASAARLRSSP